MAAPPVRGAGACHRGGAASWASAMRQTAAQPVVHMDQGGSAPVGGRWVARWINVTLIGFALSVRTGHAKGQTHLVGRARDPGQGGKTEYVRCALQTCPLGQISTSVTCRGGRFRLIWKYRTSPRGAFSTNMDALVARRVDIPPIAHDVVGAYTAGFGLIFASRSRFKARLCMWRANT